MRRIVTAVRSLIDRALALVPHPLNIVTLGSYLGVAYFISLYEPKLAIGWLAGIPFLAAVILQADAYRRGRTS